MAFDGSRQNPAPVFSTAEMGEGGAELFYSCLLELPPNAGGFVGPLMVQSMAWQPGTLQYCRS